MTLAYISTSADLLSCLHPGLGVSITDAPSDGVLEDGDVLLQGVCAPGVQQLVQELARLSANQVGLAGHVAGHDGDEAICVNVLKGQRARSKASTIILWILK